MVWRANWAQIGLYANATHTAWSAVLALASVPFLLKALGLEAYGLIALLMTTQALFMAMDLGLTASVNRYVARFQAQGDDASIRNLIACLRPFYQGVGVAIFILGVGLSDYAVRDWLRLDALSQSTATRAMYLIALAIGLRWSMALYQAVLIGLGKLHVSSSLALVATSASYLGGVAIAYLSKSVVAYLAWLALCSLLHMAALMHVTRELLPFSRARAGRSLAFIVPILKFSFKMAGVSFTGMLIMQADKALLSRQLPMVEFSAYSLAWALSTGLYVILAPTFNTVAPRFAALAALQDNEGLQKSFASSTRVFACVLFPVVASGVACAQDLLFLWVGEASLSQSLEIPLMLLLLGTAINGVMHMPYALQLAEGRADLSLAINVLLCVVYFPVLYSFVQWWGLSGAAAAWLLVNSLYFVVGVEVTRRALLSYPPLLPWLARDLALPLMLAVLLYALVTGASELLGLQGLAKLVTGSIFAMAFICAGLNYLCKLQLKHLVFLTHDKRAARLTSGSPE